MNEQLTHHLFKQFGIASDAMREGLIEISLFASDEIRELYYATYEKILFEFHPLENITEGNLQAVIDHYGFLDSENKIVSEIKLLNMQ